MELDLPTYLKIWRHMWMLPNRFGAEQTSWQKRVIRNFQEKEKSVITSYCATTFHAPRWIQWETWVLAAHTTNAMRDLVLKVLNLSQCQPWPNFETKPLWVQGIRIVPNGFAIGALHLATMATLHLRALHKTKTCSPERIFISCQSRLKNWHLKIV